jgi:cytochrome b pre-mRNA-processing protein 3
VRQGRARRDHARLAYQRVVEQSRQPRFFAECGVPDTLDGRFELICLHAFLYLNRLKAERPAASGLAQAFFDTMFADLDRALREMGVGDLSVGRQVKRMAQGFYGRIHAYEAGLAGDAALLRQALARNLFGTVDRAPDSVAAMAAYLQREAASLHEQPAHELLLGRIAFGAPPGDSDIAASTPRAAET